MVVPFESFGASKRVVWSLHSPRLEAPNVPDFAAVSPLLWFRHAPLCEHPLVIPPFLRGYRGGYCSPCRRHDFHDAEFAVLSLLDDIDGRIRSTKVLIEQKSLGKDLRAGIRQSDNSLLNPFQQARRYVDASLHAGWRDRRQDI